jgi:hypothetical protein
MSFLSLPRELRNVIYASIADPINPPSSSRGLYLSCRQIREEYTSAYSTFLLRCILHLENRAQGIRVSLFPSTSALSVKGSLRLELSTRVYTDYQPGLCGADGSVFAPLYGMCLDVLTIAFREDEGVLFGIDHLRWLHRWVVQGLLVREDGVRVSRVVIELPYTRSSDGVRSMETLMNAGLRRKGLSERVVCVSEERVEDGVGEDKGMKREVGDEMGGGRIVGECGGQM